MGRKEKHRLIDALGELTAAAARADDRAADIAKVTGLSEATVRRRLEDVSHGKKLVRNVFEDRWPSDDDEGEAGKEVDAEALGELTAAAARADDRAADIAKVTGLSEATVRRRLEDVSHGRKLVRNVFEDRWPSDDDEGEAGKEVDAEALGELTAAAARADDRAADIAKVTGLSEATVRRRLEDVSHGRKLVRNVFEDRWPSDDDEGEAGKEVDAEALGELTAAAARADDRAADIAKVTGLSEATVRRRLEDVSHGRKLVRNVFEDRWPSDDDEGEAGKEVDAEALGELTAAAARADDRAADIAKVTGLSEATVRRRLEDVSHGRKLVRNVFEDRWPSDDDEGEAGKEVDAEALGELTAAAARADDRAADIAKVTGLSEATVRRRLEDVSHGKKLVRNVFEDRWPSDDDEGEAGKEVDAEALGELTAAAARADDRAADIAKVTGLSEATVRRRLEDVSHGRKLVRNVFEDRWPSDDDEGEAGKEVDAEALGELTAAAARADDRAADIAKVTGLSEATVRRRLEDVSHGRKLVRNVFEDRWPSDDDEGEAGKEVDAEALGELTAAAARADDRAADIAKVTGLSEATVRRRLEDVSHGKKLVRNVFEDRWPSDEVGRPEEEDEVRGSGGARPLSRNRTPSTSATPVAPPRAAPARSVQPSVVLVDAGPQQRAATAIKIPAPLRKAYQEDKLALFCGSGLSLGSDVKGRLPGWKELPHRLLDACDEYDRLDNHAIELKRQRFTVRMSLEQMLSELGSLRTDLGRNYQAALNSIFRPSEATPGAAHRAIVGLGVRAILTTNYDQLLEHVHETPLRQVYTWKEASHALEDLRCRRKVLLKVHGTAERHDTVVMSELEYERVRANDSYQSVLRYLLQEHVFLFVGYGMNDPLDLDLALKHNAEMFKSAAQQHYLLLCDPSDNDRDRYERSYNVRVIPYSAHVQVPEFLAELATARTTPA
ncbi:SIR2 family NAD-dependent protein deacylase [Sorangium sp. So ce542]|uniref:SIR2 family NAD-dependent protein deacylase n=1 Tax=Sorangium sp. So ce542 TaxID=3133316 RepID=UPI003F648B45